MDWFLVFLFPSVFVSRPAILSVVAFLSILSANSVAWSTKILERRIASSEREIESSYFSEEYRSSAATLDSSAALRFSSALW
nr:Uncharacterized protein A9P81_4336 [Leptospira interrogans serovar Copenhageni/Icterohaemorrhagiae]